MLQDLLSEAIEVISDGFALLDGDDRFVTVILNERPNSRRRNPDMSESWAGRTHRATCLLQPAAAGERRKAAVDLRRPRNQTPASGRFADSE